MIGEGCALFTTELGGTDLVSHGTKKPTDIPDADRDFYLERRYPAFGNLVPRDVASRAAKERCEDVYKRQRLIW